ncbi:MAG: SCO family protein [Proteobacteria bacterium]|nr:SCO family protein [Pseudomonadota bacterium]
MKSVVPCAVMLLAAALCPIVSADDKAAQNATKAAEPGVGEDSTAAAKNPSRSGAHEYFTDVQLVDQHGNSQRLYTDLLKDKVVVLSSFFTNCEDSCPIVAGKFAALQEELGERLGSQVRLILLTTDPLRDTPDVLSSYADKFNARPGWYFLTGDKSELDFALHRFNHYTPTPEAHSNVILSGN